MNDYYVYEHLRNDNNACFYVGKGCKNRANYESRNPKHDEIVKKYGMHVNIIADNLSEDDAFDLECFTIMDYVFNKGYSIDIDGYENDSEFSLTNLTFGGRGSYGSKHTEEWCEQHSLDVSGDKNVFWNRNMWEELSDEEKEKRKIELSKMHSGKNNAMYGVSPKERMSKDVYNIWLKKQRERKRTGKDNPNYGNHILHEIYSNNPELAKEKLARPGSQNGRAKKVYMYSIDMEYIRCFDYIGECAEYVKNTLELRSKLSSISASIGYSISHNKPYRNYYFFFEKQ